MASDQKNRDGPGSHADLLIAGVPVHGAGAASSADAIAVGNGHVLGVGAARDIRRYQGPATRLIAPARGCVIPGLIDGHAHMDREGLKHMLPSLDGADGKAAVLERVRALAAVARPGAWIVTMPVGTAPGYDSMQGFEDGGYPDRHDLDRAAPDNPVYIRAIWGYWRARLPLVSIANSKALELAGIGRDTAAPADVEIAKDPSGEPTGVFLENTMMPIVELTLMAIAPNFTYEDRLAGLRRSMAVYNGFGTTGVYEGHGVAGSVMAAYEELARHGGLTVRPHLVVSPRWSEAAGATPAAQLRDVMAWLARKGHGDETLRIGGLYAEIDEEKANWIRARAAPQTGWAGFHYDCGLPRAALKEVLIEAARLGLQVACIFAEVAALYEEVHREIPIDGLRWSWGHLATITRDEVARARDLGLVMVTHTNRHIARSGSRHLARLGVERQDEIVPLRRLLDAGVPVSFGTDNHPPSMFHPVYHAIARRDATTGEMIAPGQRLARAEALTCATWGGAYLAGREHELGTLEPGRKADIVVLNGDLMTVPEDAIPGLRAEACIVGGKVVFDRDAAAPNAGNEP